jgi:small-conductance mechanosensitive channel
MMRDRHQVFALYLLILVIGITGHVHAAANNIELTANNILKTLDSAEKELKREDVRIDELESLLKKLPEHRNWASQCLQDRESELKDFNKDLESLGEYIKGEPDDVTKKRNSIKASKSASEKLNATCKLILLRTEESIASISQLKQTYLAEKYFVKGPSFVQLARENWENPGVWLKASREFIFNNSGLDKITLPEFFLLLILIAVSIAVGLRISKNLGLWADQHPPADSQAASLANALVQTIIRYTPYLLPGLCGAVFFFVVTREIKPVPFISIVAYGLPIVTILLSLIHAFLRSSLELKVIKSGQEAIARKLSHRLKTLVLIIFLGYLLFSTILAQSLPESALLMTRSVYGAVIILNLAMVIYLVGRFSNLRSTMLFRMVIILLLFTALFAELYGYRNISMYILRTVLGSLIAYDIYKLLSILTTELIDSMEKGQGRWQKKLHTGLGLKPEQAVPGLIWIRLIISLLLWTGLIGILVVIWKIPDNYTQTLISYITTGFTIGSVDIKPLRVLQAILIFPILLTINAWFRKGLEHRWFTRTQMERGTRESMSTIVSYIGISIAVIISLSIAGLDFSKLALIAGALSVGIGFGLQNIVNNFVSGLILLFERPIKTGDWIQVGTVEGYVRKISIRSTQIQTFDRSDVIVPNSDLISGTVTNWMLYDQRGRIRVPVGVAYGSNTQLVKELLLEVANKHERVIKNPMLAPTPVVFFLGFGDSSLNFDLRCHISNIDTRIATISEINFAIDEIFRKNGIEIPFPQRDLHVRDISTTRNNQDILPDNQDKDKDTDN